MSRVREVLLTPGEPGFSPALSSVVWNDLKPPREPAAIVRARTVQDAVDAVALARTSGWKVTARSGGHAWTGYSVVEGGLVIDMSALGGIEYDAATGIVSVEPGVRSRDLTRFLAEHGRTFPGGHCPTVGVTGFTLGGGFGFNSRVVGPACFSIQAIDAITGDGDLRRYDDESAPELLWAARGTGPGFFGVITKLHLATYPAPGVLGASMQCYPLASLPRFAPWFLETAASVDPRVNPVVIGTHFPGQADPVLLLTNYCFADDLDEMRELLRPFEESPLRGETIMTVPPHESSFDEQYAILDQHYPEGFRYVTDNVWANPSEPGFLEAAHRVFATLPSERSHAIWAPWVEQTHPGAAFSMQSSMSMNVYAVYDDEADDERMAQWHAEAIRGLIPYSNGGGKLNDSDLYRRPMKALSDSSLARYRAARDLYDPDRVFSGYPHLDD